MHPKITKKHFINRDLSWLDFNSRVLDEAGDMMNPVLERLKFIAIFSNNLDEFFMVRVAGLRQQLEADDKGTDPSGMSVKEQLEHIRKKVIGLIERQHKYLNMDILPELRKHRTVILSRNELSLSEKKEYGNYFEKEILPALTPIAVDPSHPFPIINSGSIELLVKLKHHDSGKTVLAFVEVPSVLPRFIPVVSPHFKNARAYILLEDLIIENINMLFSKCQILEVFPFRLTRDMDFSVDEEGVADLLSHIEEKLLHRKRRDPIRLEVLKDGNIRTGTWLMRQLELDRRSVYHVEGPLNHANFFEFIAKENRPEITEETWPQLHVPGISDKTSIFDSIRTEGSIPLFHPFQSFTPVVNLLEEAADDPDVLAIKQTLYRVGGDSPVIPALQRAAENGKQVTAIVELKARFDEGNNIVWAKRLEESGAHVIYGVPGLKIHCKALLIIRKEEGTIRRYLHVSTGNYNDKTAGIYTDIGLFTTDPELCADISALFNVMTGYSANPERWNKISTSPTDMKEKFTSLIERETRLSTKHNPGHIIAKMNSLVDSSIIESLYKAAYAGVKIDLLVRGICCLKPGIGTNNINVLSIVDRYLEHSRIYYFANAGNPEYYLSSADWMPRNLYKRIEILFPVESGSTQKFLRRILELELNDKRKGRKLLPSGKYTKTLDLGTRFLASRSQRKIYEMFN